MPYGRRRKLPPVTTEKHEGTWSNLAQNAGPPTTEITLVTCLRNPTADLQVPIGAHIRWFYLEFHFSAEVTTSPKVIHWLIQKVPQAVGSMESVPSTYDNTIKKYIIKRGMEMLPSDQSTVFKRVFAVRVPRWMQRCADADVWQFRYVSSSTETINSCGFFIFRSYI